MKSASTNIKSSKSSDKNLQSKKRNFSLTSNTLNNQLYKPPSKSISSLYHVNTFHSGISVSSNKVKGSRVTSLNQFQEEKKLKDIERLKKIHENEIENLFAYKLYENLTYLKSKKEQEFLKKEINNLDDNSLKNINNRYLSLAFKKIKENKKKEEEEKRRAKEKEKEKEQNKEKEGEEGKEKNKMIKSESKRVIKGNLNNNIGKIVPPKPLKIINDKNYHENVFLMNQANKNQIYEITQKKNQKRLEKKERLKIIKNEYIQIKKMIESERASKNLLKNEYDLNLRRKLIQDKIQIRDLNVSQNRKRKNEINDKKVKMNKIIEEEKLNAIKKLKESEEKDRINYYNALIKKDKEKEQKKLESSEDKRKIYEIYDEFIKKRSVDFKNIKNFIKNGIDENNVERFYSLFPENKKIKEMFEKYKKLKKEIENSSGNDFRKKLGPIKSKSSFETSDNCCRTSNNFRKRTIKMKKDLIESKSKDNIKKNIKNINNNNNEKNKIINFCATVNSKSNKHFEKVKDNNFNNNDENNKNDIVDNKNINQNINENVDDNNGNKDHEVDNNKVDEEKKKVLYENEIEEKVKKYQKERYQSFIEMLEREKNNEFYRNENLKNITNEKAKKELEILYGKERTIVSLRLKKENEKIKLDIENYEKRIREEDKKNHRYNMNLINK